MFDPMSPKDISSLLANISTVTDALEVLNGACAVELSGGMEILFRISQCAGRYRELLDRYEYALATMAAMSCELKEGAIVLPAAHDRDGCRCAFCEAHRLVLGTNTVGGLQLKQCQDRYMRVHGIDPKRPRRAKGVAEEGEVTLKAANNVTGVGA